MNVLATKLKVIANNAIYFNDSSKYISALIDICEACGMKEDDIGKEYIEPVDIPACKHEYWFRCSCGESICNKCGQHYSDKK